MKTPSGQTTGADDMRFYTIGYGGRVPDEFASLLVLHGIRCVADATYSPGSRQHGRLCQGPHGR